jgi:hypothetical protein
MPRLAKQPPDDLSVVYADQCAAYHVGIARHAYISQHVNELLVMLAALATIVAQTTGANASL